MGKKTAELLLAMLFVSLLIFQNFPRAQAHQAHKRCPNTLVYYNFLSERGDNSSNAYNAVLSAQPTQLQPFRFGQTYAFDMPLLAGPSLTSELVGRVQGTYIFISQTGGFVFVTETYKINTTRCNGTFSGVGLEELGKASSKPIVGGTGDFELVTGIASTVLISSQTVNSNFQAWFKYTFKFNYATWTRS